VDVVLRLLGCTLIIRIGLGEGVCKAELAAGQQIRKAAAVVLDGTAHAGGLYFCASVPSTGMQMTPDDEFQVRGGRVHSPKVLRFSMDINSCLAGGPGVSLLVWEWRRCDRRVAEDSVWWWCGGERVVGRRFFIRRSKEARWEQEGGECDEAKPFRLVRPVRPVRSFPRLARHRHEETARSLWTHSKISTQTALYPRMSVPTCCYCEVAMV
jgi:hypothetical protein